MIVRYINNPKTDSRIEIQNSRILINSDAEYLVL